MFMSVYYMNAAITINYIIMHGLKNVFRKSYRVSQQANFIVLS